MRLSDLLTHRELPHLERLVGAWCLVGTLPEAGDAGWSYRTDVQIPAGPRNRVGLGDEVLPLRKRVEGRAFADVILLGRAVSNDVIIPHESISKLHARCEILQGGVKVSDAGSSNGTRRGLVAVGKDGVMITDGDDVVFGSCAFILLSTTGLQTVLGRVKR